MKKKRGRDRKQTVIMEWTILITVVAVLAILVIGGVLLSIRSPKKETRAAQEKADLPLSDGEEPIVALEADAKEEEGMSETGETQEEADPVHRYIFSFAGDCTIGSLLEWQGSEPGDFQSVVGTDYAYPLSNVKHLFSEDDLTVVNLEGTFTHAEEAVEKPYRFKSDPAYVQVLTEGSVEAVSASNNHAEDFLEEGVRETLATLDTAGIWYTRAGNPLIKELEGGLKLGIVSYNTVDNWESEETWRGWVERDIETCKEAGCSLIIGFMHWGTVEYLTEPEDWEVEFAHDMVDWGCDLIVGGHAHILQRMEYYSGVPIFYSMGNFCYGGHLNPEDKDSVIVRAEYTWNSSRQEVSRSDLSVIPCKVSSRDDKNDYCPTPCPEGSQDYRRILERLEWAG